MAAGEIVIRWDLEKELYAIRPGHYTTVWAETESMAVLVGLALVPNGRIDR